MDKELERYIQDFKKKYYSEVAVPSEDLELGQFISYFRNKYYNPENMSAVELLQHDSAKIDDTKAKVLGGLTNKQLESLDEKEKERIIAIISDISGLSLVNPSYNFWAHSLESIAQKGSELAQKIGKKLWAGLEWFSERLARGTLYPSMATLQTIGETLGKTLGGETEALKEAPQVLIKRLGGAIKGKEGRPYEVLLDAFSKVMPEKESRKWATITSLPASFVADPSMYTGIGIAKIFPQLKGAQGSIVALKAMRDRLKDIKRITENASTLNDLRQAQKIGIKAVKTFKEKENLMLPAEELMNLPTENVKAINRVISSTNKSLKTTEQAIEFLEKSSVAGKELIEKPFKYGLKTIRVGGITLPPEVAQTLSNIVRPSKLIRTVLPPEKHLRLYVSLNDLGMLRPEKLKELNETMRETMVATIATSRKEISLGKAQMKRLERLAQEMGMSYEILRNGLWDWARKSLYSKGFIPFEGIKGTENTIIISGKPELMRELNKYLHNFKRESDLMSDYIKDAFGVAPLPIIWDYSHARKVYHANANAIAKRFGITTEKEWIEMLNNIAKPKTLIEKTKGYTYVPTPEYLNDEKVIRIVCDIWRKEISHRAKEVKQMVQEGMLRLADGATLDAFLKSPQLLGVDISNMLIKDLPLLESYRNGMLLALKGREKLISEIAKFGTKKVEMGYRPVKIKELEELYFPEEIAEYIEKRFHPLTTSVVSDIFETLNKYFRKNLLAYFPSWMTRNIIGNFWNSIVEVGPSVLKPHILIPAIKMASLSLIESSYKLQKLLEKIGKIGRADILRRQVIDKLMESKFGKEVFVTAKGEVLTMKKLFEKFEDTGILSGGMYAHEIEKGSPLRTAKEMVNILTEGIAKKTNPFNRIPVFGMNDPIAQTMLKTNEFIENVARASVALAVIKRGGTLEEAVKRVNRALFNYAVPQAPADPTIRKFVLFWNWYRNNLYFQASKALQHPVYATIPYKIKSSLEKELMPDRLLIPTNHLKRYVFPVGGKHFIPLENFLPLVDLNYLLDPLRFIGEATHPLVNFVIMATTGRDIRYERQLFLKDQPLGWRDYALLAITNSPWARLYYMISRYFTGKKKEELEADAIGTLLKDWVLPFKVYSYEPFKQMGILRNSIENIMRKMEIEASHKLEDPDPDAIQEAKELLENIQRLRNLWKALESSLGFQAKKFATREEKLREIERERSKEIKKVLKGK